MPSVVILFRGREALVPGRLYHTKGGEGKADEKEKGGRANAHTHLSFQPLFFPFPFLLLFAEMGLFLPSSSPPSPPPRLASGDFEIQKKGAEKEEGEEKAIAKKVFSLCWGGKEKKGLSWLTAAAAAATSMGNPRNEGRGGERGRRRRRTHFSTGSSH